MDKIKFSNITKQLTDRVNIREEKGKNFVKFGEYNSFPNQLIELYIIVIF